MLISFIPVHLFITDLINSRLCFVIYYRSSSSWANQKTVVKTLQNVRRYSGLASLTNTLKRNTWPRRSSKFVEFVELSVLEKQTFFP